MMSQQHIYSLMEDDDEDSSDVKEVMPCPPYMSPGSYGGSSKKFSQHPALDDQIKMERGNLMDISPAGNTMLHSCISAINNHSTSTSSAMSGHHSVKQREVSEYTYAQALLKQAPKLTSTGDLDRTSVLRLAQAYITLQQGLQCWENSGNRTTWWPDYLDGGSLTLAAQETMNCFVLIMTSQGNVVYVSDAVESLLGHDQLNLVGRTIQTLVHPEEMPVLAAQFHLIIGPTGRQTLQRSFYTRMLNLRRSGAEHQQFELVHIIGHLQDVSLATGQSGGGGQRETWLMCACRVMSPLVEKEGSGSPYTEWVSHNALDGKILYMDARSCQVTGYLPNEMVGRSTYCFIHQDDQEHVAFSHKQALINVGGSSSTYRMYRRSNDLVYVHTTTQLARDKHSNKPKFLFCVNHVVDEHEGKLQVSRHQQDLMWDKSDPSIKYSMTDIERTVKALEAEGGNSPPVVSKGGMKMSKLTESCSADGGDLLNVNIPAMLRVPPLLFKSEKDQWSGTSPTCHQQGGMKSHFNTGGRYQHQGQSLVSSPLPGAGYGGSYGFDNSPGSSGQHGLFNRASSQQQQQQQTQGNLYGSQRHPYPSQVSMSNSSSMCHSMMSGSSPGDSPLSVSGTGSYVDYLYDNSGSPSVPDDGSLFNADALLSPSMLTATGRARGRGRTRGRPRGSGRGGRGVTRGVRGSRGPRGGRGGRGRGRGANISQLSQMGEVMGTLKKADGMVSCGSMSPISVRSNMSPRANISPMGSPGEMFPSPNSNSGLQRSTSTVGNKSQQQGVELQRLYSDGYMQGDIRSSSLQRMASDDGGMFQRMTSLDGIDVLEASSDFVLPRGSNDDLLSPNSWGQDRSQSVQVAPYRTIQGSKRVPEKKVGRPRGSRAHHDRHQHNHRTQSDDDPMSSLVGFGGGGQQSPAYGHSSPFTGQNVSFQGHSPRGGAANSGENSNSSFQCQNQMSGSNTNNSRSQDNFQRSISFQGQAVHHMTTAADTQDPEHSILGNLLKGRGGSTSSTGSKSPVHTVLTTLGRSPSHSMGLDKSARTPALQSLDKGCRSPGHQLMSDATSPVSVISPDPSQTSSFIKDEPDLISPNGDQSEVTSSTQIFSSNALQSHQLGLGLEQSLVEQGDHKSLSEMQMFSTQLRQKHKTLERSLESQDILLSQLESHMQQVTKDLNPESVYSKLNARLEIIKSDKSKLEKELRVTQAQLEDQVRLQQQHQLRQQQQLQLQQLDLQRHRLNSPAPTNTRRMAIVPPIQRQPTEGDMNQGLSQHGMGDVKSNQCVGMQHDSLDMSGGGKSMPVTSLSDSGTKLSSLQDSRQQTKHRQDSATLSAGGPATQNRNVQHQPAQPSPYSLHHHHHHHHHYHHHPIPTPCLPQQQHMEFSGPLKGTPPPPPPPYGSFENSMYTAALAPSALSISVTAGNNSLSSPIICDTSPVSVDESPSCASDASSGYHSLSHGVDANNGSTIGQYAKGHGLDMPTSTLPPYNSKTPPSFGQSHQGSVKSPDFMSSSKSPST